MEEKKKLLLSLIEHPALLLNPKTIKEMKEEVFTSVDEGEVDAFMDVIIEIIERRVQIVNDLSHGASN
ncbi:MAG TPA: hypothetical protein PLF31_03420 [Candidatus Paceibacterota bacterium]|nr:hypothetical protein [Candidatus Paceibacterota bacterium]